MYPKGQSTKINKTKPLTQLTALLFCSNGKFLGNSSHQVGADTKLMTGDLDIRNMLQCTIEV